MIYIIGDSHGSVFCGRDHIQPQWGFCYTNKCGLMRDKSLVNEFIQDNKNFYSIRSGIQLAYNMNNNIDLIDSLIKDNDISKDANIIFFCYGEIDIRAHVGFQADLQDKHHSEINAIIIHNYIKFLNYYKNLGYSVGAYGPIATTIDNLNYYPRYKDCITRNEITRDFNNQLKTTCEDNDILFRSIFEYMIDEDGSTKPECLMDQLHASQHCMKYIMEQFNDII